jgi:hypothetical protein
MSLIEAANLPAHRLTAEKKAGDCDCDDDYGTYGEDRIISQRSALPGILVVRPISRSISCNRPQHREPSFTFSMGDIAFQIWRNNTLDRDEDTQV